MGNQVNYCACASKNEDIASEKQVIASSRQSYLQSKCSSCYNLHNNYFRQDTQQNDTESERMEFGAMDNMPGRKHHKRIRKQRLSEQVDAKPIQVVKPKEKAVYAEPNTVNNSRFSKIGAIENHKSEHQHVNFDISKSQIQNYQSESGDMSGSFMFKDGKSRDLQDTFQERFKMNSRILGSHSKEEQEQSPDSFMKLIENSKTMISKKSHHQHRQSLTVKSCYKHEVTEQVIKEGELLKICPGVARQSMQANRDLNGGILYIPRWCQITSTRFRYYKNRIAACTNPDKPLVSLPLVEISQIDKNVINKDEKEFEILMNKPLQDYIYARSNSQDLRQYGSIQSQKNQSPTRGVKPGHLLRVPQQRNQIKTLQTEKSPYEQDENPYIKIMSPFTPQKNELSLTQIFESPDKNKWSTREHTWYQIEEKLVFKNNKDSNIDNGHFGINEWVKAIHKQKNAIIKEKLQKVQWDNSNYQPIQRDGGNHYYLTFAMKD